MGDATSYEQRRREFRQRRPAHHCPQCSSVLYPEDDKCLECDARRPEGGWPALADSTERWLGRVLDERYLLTRRIGRGSSGAVYRADSLRISRRFAVKIISLDGGPDEVDLEHIEARLSREIEAMSRLRNPHIVSFYDVLSLDDRTVALLMDLIEGQTLQRIVQRGEPLPIERACDILRQAANGVHEAHEAGLIHRDLKPENIMLERLPAGDDFVHLLDFGIVWREGDVHLTQGFLGTPLYASPEQAVGGDLDRRADIYALGGVLFFMLTGRPPFYDENIYRVLKAHVSSQPPSLGEVAQQRVFPDELEALVARMLAKNPGDRPQTLAAVIETLDELQEGRASKRRSAADDSRELQPDNIRETGGDCELHETVESEASVEEIEQAAAEESQEQEFFRSDEWDTTGPKAAILRGRTPSQVEALDESSSAAASAEAEAFSRRAEARSRSGLFPLFTEQQPCERTLCFLASNASGRLALADEDNNVFVGEPGEGFDARLELSTEADLSAMSLSESWLATGHVDGSLWRWSLDDGQGEMLHQNAAGSPIVALACGERGRWLAVGTQDGGLYLAELSDNEGGQPLRTQSGAPFEAVALSNKSNLFAVARDDGHIDVYDLSSPTSRVQRIEAQAAVATLAFSNDGYLLAVAFADRSLALYQALNGHIVMRNDDLIEQPLSVQFDEDDQLVGFCEADGTLYRWDLHHNLVEQSHPR